MMPQLAAFLSTALKLVPRSIGVGECCSIPEKSRGEIAVPEHASDVRFAFTARFDLLAD